MKRKDTIRIVLSSPSDVEDEHRVVEEIINELNKGAASISNVFFELTRWKTDAFPGFHKEGPQGLIDPILAINNCDILIGIFWKKFGTPTKGSLSGTEHEFFNAYKSWKKSEQPQIMMYFKESKVHLDTSEDVTQYLRVKQFKEKFPKEGLFWTFTNISEFERLLRNHLIQFIKHNTPNRNNAETGKKDTERKIIRNYNQKLKQQFSTINLFGSEDKKTTPSNLHKMMNISSGFIPLHLQEWRESSNKQNSPPLEIDDIFFSNESPRHFLLRGLPGSGKTTLLKYLTYRFASIGAVNQNKCIPVYIRCKDFSSLISLEEFIMQQINENSDSKACYNILTLTEYFLETAMVLLFDGLDEIEDDQTSENFRRELVRLRKQYPRCKLIVSSRPIKLNRDNFPAFRHLDVLCLNPIQINEYLEQWFCGNRTKIDDLKMIFENRPRIRALATSPFLLSMICFAHDNSDEAALVERRSDLYANCTTYLLQRRYDPSSRSNSKRNHEHILKILKDISLRFFLWQESSFPIKHVNVIGEYSFCAEKIGKTEAFLDDIQHKTGLIQRTKDGFSFVHRSLWEYFTALALQDKSLDFVIKHAANPDWEEVIRLYTGLLPEEADVISLVNNLWNINRPLALRVTTESRIPASKLIKPQIENEEGNQSKLLLIDSLIQSLPLIPQAEQKNLLQETLHILLLECAERDCEVIYRAQELLEEHDLNPLDPSGLVYRLLDLEHAKERQEKCLEDSANHFRFINIKGGTFPMGDNNHEQNERPIHQVKITSFSITKHPVTNKLLSIFPFRSNHSSSGGDHFPAVNISWFEAYYFALWISARLPTEAEWEYAARGGKDAPHAIYYFGDLEEELKNHAWFGESDRKFAHSVKELNPLTKKENVNSLGLANMLGNVWEWCSDWYDENYFRECASRGVIVDPAGPSSGSHRVMRGGRWFNFAQYCRSSYRYYYGPDYRRDFIGFRLVLT